MKGFDDLLCKGERVKGFKEDSGYTKVGEAALVDSLDLCGEKKDRDPGDGGSLLHSAEGGRPIDLRHHDVHQNGIGLLSNGDFDSCRTGIGGKDLPTGGGLQRQRGYFADIILVINYQHTSHERTYLLI